MKKRNPNLFIIGAPKCGTTSVTTWLKSHPQVFVPEIKEPHFFNFDSGHRDIKTLRQYEKIYSAARPEQTVLCDASVWYLISSVAVKNILAYQPNAKVIVFVRNPIDMCVSLHDEMVFGGDEEIQDFREAWNAQFQRKIGLNLPRVCVDLRFFIYGEACKVGEQISGVKKLIPSEQLLFVRLDQLKFNPSQEYRKILQFLGVSDDGREDFPVVNSAKERKSLILRRFMRGVHLFKNKMGIYRGTGLLGKINKWNTRERRRNNIDNDLIQELKTYFEEDLLLLQRETGEDLSDWLEL